MSKHRMVSLPSRGVLAGVAAALGTSAVADRPAQSLTMAYDEGAKPTPNASAAQPAPPPASWVSPKATFLLSNEPGHSDPEVLWPGFLSGMRGFEHFYEPIGNPLYFESPFVNSHLRLLFLHHDFPNDSQLGGGAVTVYAAQIRLALTDRLAFIATKDGYSEMDARILPEASGWNDFAVGLKYALIVDHDADFVLSAGARWELSNGDSDILMGGSDEISPFISFAKGWGQSHLLGNVTGRIPTDSELGNCVLSWDLHADYEIAPDTLPGFAPAFELRGLHYLSDGGRLPLSVGGYDYSNIGSNDVAGDSVIAGGVGFRWKFNPHASLGAMWDFPLTDPDDDIMGNRVTLDFMLSW